MRIPSNIEVRLYTCDFPLEYPVSGPEQALHCITDEPLKWLHYHNSLEIGYCYSGSGILLSDGEIYTYEKGSAIFVPAGCLHNLQSLPGIVSEWRFITMEPEGLLRGDLFEGLQRYANGQCAAMAVRDEAMSRLILETIDQQLEGPAGYRDCVRGLVRAIVSLAAAKGQDDVRRNPALIPAIEYMMRNYAEPIAMPELACRCAMSESTLRREFRALCGMTPGEYLARLRVRMAALALRQSDASVLEVAEAFGFGSITTLERQFRRLMGCAPQQWRKG